MQKQAQSFGRELLRLSKRKLEERERLQEGEREKGLVVSMPLSFSVGGRKGDRALAQTLKQIRRLSARSPFLPPPRNFRDANSKFSLSLSLSCSLSSNFLFDIGIVLFSLVLVRDDTH